MAPLLIAALWTAEVPLSEKVVEYARSRLGEQVGDGECTALAAAALRHAGARLRRGSPTPWGEEVDSLRDARPGDILQFENAVFVRHRVLENGGILTTTMTFDHHTAIIAGVRKRGPRPILVILHQNVHTADSDDVDGKVVQQATLNLAEKRSGSIRVFRPTPMDDENGGDPRAPGRDTRAPGRGVPQ
jgi:hypothetical protein